MSASRERKMRVEQNSLAQPETKKKPKKKLSEGWIFAICMVLILVLVVGGIFVYRHFQAHKTVLTVGDYDVEVCEFNYFYREIAATCDQYASYLGLEQTALDKQKIDASDLSMMGVIGLDTACLGDQEPVDGVYKMTWAELIADNAKRNAASAYSVYQAAQKAGYKMTEEEKESIDAAIADIKTYAKQNNMSVDEYIEAVFGRGCDEASYRKYLKVVTIASSYPATIEYTAEEMDARDAEAPEDFDAVSFYYYVTDATTIKAEQDEKAAEAEEGEETESTETTEETTEEPELTDEQKAELDKLAKEAAEAMSKEFDVESDKVAIHADYTREILESSAYNVELPEEALDWLYGEAKADEVKMFTIEANEELEDDENRYVVVKFISGEDYKTANFLSIAIPDDEEGAEVAEGESAADKVADIKAALEADPSEEKFRELVLREHMADGADHDHDHEEIGLSENQTRYAAASASKELFTWLMLEKREAGNWTVIDMEGQTVFYFYLGEGEGYRHLSIESTMRSEWYNETTENAIANCNYDKDAAMSGEVKFYN